MFTPRGMAWIEGYGRHTGYWEGEESARCEPAQTQVRYPADEPDHAGGAVIRVPADAPASKAALMKLAADVQHLESLLMTFTTRLRGAGVLLDLRRGEGDAR